MEMIESRAKQSHPAHQNILTNVFLLKLVFIVEVRKHSKKGHKLLKQ